MIRYALKRFLMLIPVTICVSFVVFALMDLTPGTVVDAMLAEALTAEDIAILRAQHNLDRSMFYRYWLYMVNLLQGDLGVSDVTQLSVWNLFIGRLPATLILAFTSIAIGAAIAVPLGIIAAKRAGTILDNAISVFTMVGISMPLFWLGLLLLDVFSLRLGWFPAGGNWDGIRSLVLPAICSGMWLMASATRQTRSSMLEVLNMDYLRTARAKGVPEEAVIRKHALGNAWIPIITIIGASLGMALSGSVVIETVFAWPGVGRLAADAMWARDVTTTTGVVVLFTVMFVLVQIIVDIVYAAVDPRIKSQFTSSYKKRKKTLSSSLADSAAQPIPDTSHDVGIPDLGEAVVSQIQEQKSNLLLGETDSDSPPPEKNYATRSIEDISMAAEQSLTSNKENESDSNTVRTYKSALRKYRKRSQLGEVFHRLKKNKGALVGLIIMGVMILLLFSSLFISWEAITVGVVRERLTSPNIQHPFGTDHIGRSMFFRIIYGTRFTFAIGLGGAVIAAFFGISLGAFAGYYGGKADEIIMRASDIISAIPGILLGMVIVTVLGANLQNLILAVGVNTIPFYVRITRASLLSVRSNEFIEAARAIGFSDLRIIFTQALPNGLAPIIVTFAISTSLIIIVASSMSFMGFGIPVPYPEWGSLIASGRDFMRVAPFLTTIPGIFLLLTILALNLLGDGLRDALDPKLKR